ncbi:MAG: LysR family transcriptional regulator [Algicola sp.]|nr:LysR family transcriptional regulator [Algicola sp.]
MDTIDGIKTIVAVVETGSFTAAGERLGMSKALVSKYVGEVEQRIDVRLFNRSTRRLSLTEAGKEYYDRAVPLLEEFTALADNVAISQTAVQGRLRVSAPVTFGEMSLSPVIVEFMALYPKIQLDLQLTDRKVDMVADAIDVEIRIGSVDDSTLIARQISTVPLVLCAAPDYLEQHGTPVEAQDLAKHQCIIDSNFRIGEQWPLTSSKKVTETVKVSSRIAVNSPKAVKEIALAGGGIGLIPEFIVEDALFLEDLKQVLPEHTVMSFGLYAIYPHRQYLPRKVRCFIDFLLERFGE